MYGNISVFVLLALLASVMGGIKEDLDADKEKCIAETGIDPELVKKPPSFDTPMNENLKCFAACLINQRGGVFRWREVPEPFIQRNCGSPGNYKFTADGTIDLEKAISAIPPDMPAKDNVITALTACADKKGANDCETAYEVSKCLREQKVLMRPT